MENLSSPNYPPSNLESISASSGHDTQPQEVSLANFVGYFLWLGAVGFGGPIALAGRMQQDLVDSRRWVLHEDYVEGLALAQLAPGPLAAQLAMYLGFVRAGWWGTTLVGIAFVLPSFLMVLALSAAYMRYGGLSWMQAVFYGVGAAVIGIIARSAGKLTKLTLKKDLLLWGIFGVLGLTTAWTSREIVWLVVAGGLVTLARQTFPTRAEATAGMAVPLLNRFLPATGLSATGGVLAIFAFFAKAGLFVFGSGLAIIPFLYGGVVQGRHWLNDRQFVDAVAIAMITPGPVVITVSFIGYVVAGVAGATAAALGVFLPVYAVVVLLAPSYKKWAKNPQLNAFVRGVTAAATGAIAGSVVVLARRSIYDWPTATIAILSLAVLLKWKVPEPLVIGMAAVAGLILR